MSLRTATQLLQFVLLVVVVALIAGQLLGQPVVFGYVTSSSMEPAIDANDGFVAVPAAVTGDPEPGDVVIYESSGDELVTHRVVDETADGYVTRGDANPVTDQEQGDPHVTNDQVVATALQLGGTVLTIPELGTAAANLDATVAAVQLWVSDMTDLQFDGTDDIATAVLALSVVGYVLETVRDRRHSALETQVRTDDIGVCPRRLAVAFALFVVVVASAAMLVPAGAESMTIVSSQPAPDGDLIVEPGGTAETSYRISNAGFTPVIAYLEPTEGVDLERETVVVSRRDKVTVAATLEAPETTGHYERSIDERRYLHVLPRSVIAGLYDVHPWLPFGVITTLLGGSAYALGRALTAEDLRERRKRIRYRCHRSCSGRTNHRQRFEEND